MTAGEQSAKAQHRATPPWRIAVLALLAGYSPALMWAEGHHAVAVITGVALVICFGGALVARRRRERAVPFPAAVGGTEPGERRVAVGLRRSAVAAAVVVGVLGGWAVGRMPTLHGHGLSTHDKAVISTCETRLSSGRADAAFGPAGVSSMSALNSGAPGPGPAYLVQTAMSWTSPSGQAEHAHAFCHVLDDHGVFTVFYAFP